MFSLRPLALIAAALTACAAHAASPVLKSKLFSMEDSGDGYFTTYASDFCGKGLMAGTTMSPDWHYVGFITNTKGEFTTYTVPGAFYTHVSGCYKSRLMGQTIIGDVRSGFYQDANGNAQLVTVTSEGGTYPMVEGMNASGTVVGWYFPKDKSNVRGSGFIITDGVFTRFDLEGHPDTRLIGILDDGTLYGTYMDGVPLRTTGFVIRGGVQKDMHIEGSYDTVITGMNAAGQIVGYYSEAIDQPYQGFAWQDGKFTKFSFAAEGGSTYPMGIDSRGNVVGYVVNTDYTQYGFVAQPAKASAGK
jgi:probable HAF family extracellular repeat protein